MSYFDFRWLRYCCPNCFLSEDGNARASINSDAIQKETAKYSLIPARSGGTLHSLCRRSVIQRFGGNILVLFPAERSESTIYQVINIHYSRSAMDLTTGKTALEYGWLEKKWEITVGAVPRDRRYFIKGLLEREALPLARTWLIEKGDCEEVGGLTLTFSFDEEQEILKVERDSRLSPKQA